ncbi:MAG TPA: DUF2190 family protein [Melioribacteraceae bacterium]|nr:DUF2190 family protein [Melioribacteraceae bacterium]
MKTEQPLLITSVTAAASIPKNRFVGFSGNLPSAGAVCLGVSNAETSPGEQMPVTVIGIVLVVAAATIAAGDPVESDSAGKAIPKTSGALTGYALDPGVTGDSIRILLK